MSGGDGWSGAVGGGEVQPAADEGLEPEERRLQGRDGGGRGGGGQGGDEGVTRGRVMPAVRLWAPLHQQCGVKAPIVWCKAWASPVGAVGCLRSASLPLSVTVRNCP